MFFNTRLIILSLIFGFLFTILVGRLFLLQIVQHEKFARRAENNRTVIIDQMPARGRIFDRYGKLIVDNQPTFSVTVDLSRFDSSSADDIQYLVRSLNIPENKIRERLREAAGGKKIEIKKLADFNEVVRLEENLSYHPGIEHQVQIHRVYAKGLRMPHILGYLAQITENQLSYYRTAEYEDADYKIGEFVGMTGIERYYDAELRGQKGYHKLEVDATGKIVRDFGTIRHPKDGYSLYLSVDLQYQRYLEHVMSGYRGAVVVMDVRTGEVLAATSQPDYDLMWFVQGISSEQWKYLNEHPDRPLFNRLVQSGYPPASTFKMITTIAGLEEGVITPNTYFACNAVFHLGGNKFRCWNVHGHGPVNAQYALTQSCDIFFYNVAWKLGINRLAKYAKMFGLGEYTGVDLPNERKGLVPTTDYFDARYGRENWKAGTVVNLGIGQGEILVTPFHAVQYAAIMANRGFYYTPHFVRYAEDENGIRKTLFQAKQLPIKRENMELARFGMWTVVNSYAGTGKKAAIKSAVVAGKTGTAENVHGKYHAWFIGFAPYLNPEIAVSVILENAGEGSDVAAPMCGRVMNYYFKEIRNKKPFDPVVGHDKPFQTLKYQPEDE